jgi:XTP/dITP diphosphohydrolase
MTIAEKSQVSHRGKALNELQQEIDKVLIWIRRHMPPEERFLYNQDREQE